MPRDTPPPHRSPPHPRCVRGSVPRQCDPNLQVYNVFIENLDERLPRIALFATRPIRAGEELTFDYNMHGTAPTPPHGPPSPTAPRPCPHVGCWALWGDDRRRGTGERLRPSMGWGGGEGGGVGNTPPLTPRSPASPVDPVDAESTRMDSNFGLAGGGLGGSPRARGRIECKCGAAACRKYLF